MDRTRRPGVVVVGQEALAMGRTFYREAEALGHSGFDVDVICPEGASVEPVASSFRVHSGGRQPGTSATASAFYAVRVVLTLLRILRGENSFVQIPFPPSSLLLASLTARLLGANVVLHMTSPVQEYYAARQQRGDGLRARWASFVERVHLRLASRVIVSTREMRDAMGRKGGDIDRIISIVSIREDSADAPERLRYRVADIADQRKEDRREGAFRVAAVTDDTHWDGTGNLIREMVSVADKMPGVTLFLVAPPSSHIHDASGRVVFVDPADREQCEQAMLAADAAVVPTMRNAYSDTTLSSAFVDFIHMEKPLVATRLRASASYFPEDTVCYYDPGHGELVNALFEVFANPNEAQVRAARALQRMHEYSWDRKEKKYVAVYRALHSVTARARPD